MTGLTPLPPYVLHSTTRLTHAQAHAHLSTFLATAENDAAYRPDSTLTERGPQSASTGANPNLTLHHLSRILRGIEGKRIGGAAAAALLDDTGRLFGDEGKDATTSALRKKRKVDGEGEGEGNEHRRRRKQVNDENPEDETAGTGVAVVDDDGEERDGWQEKEDYDLAQQDDGVDMVGEERHPGAHLEEPTDGREADEMVEIEIEDTGRKVGLSEQQHAKLSKADKDARKRAKKERLKQEKRMKEDAKANR